MQKCFLLLLALTITACAPRPIADPSLSGRESVRPSKFQRENPVNFGQWFVQQCTLQFHTTDFNLSTAGTDRARQVTFALQSRVPLLEHPQLTFNTSDHLIKLEGRNQGNSPLFRFDIPFDATLLPQLYQDGSFLILTYLPLNSSTFQQNFFNTKDALDGLNYLAKNC